MADVASLSFEIDSTQLRTGQRDLDNFGRTGEEAARKTKSSTDVMSLGLKSVTGALAGLAATISVGALIGSAISQSKAFGSALAEVGTLIEGTAQQTSFLESESRKLAMTYGGTATAQAQAFYQAISAGASSVEDAALTLDVANKLAIGGVTDVTTAVDILTTATNVYASEGLAATDVSDALFVAMRAGKTTIGELAGALGQVLPLAQNLGVSFDEVAATTAALTKGGIGTSEAVTGLRAAMTAVLGPSKQASDLAAELGINFNAASLKAMGFADFMAMVKDKTGGSSEAMQTLFGSVEATTVALSLSGAAGESLTQILADMAEKSGAAQTAFEKMSDSNQQRLAVVLSALSDKLLSVGSLLLTVMVPALEGVSAIMTFAADNADVFAAAIGVLAATQVPALITGLVSAVAWLGTMEGMFIAGAVASRALTFAMAAIPFVAATVAVVALYRGMSYLVEQTGSIGGAFDALKDIAQEVFGDRLPKLMLGIGYMASGAGADIRSAFLDALADVMDAVPDFANNIIGTFVGAKDAAIAAWEVLPAALKAIIGRAMNGVIDGVQSGISGMVSALNAIPGIDIAPPDLSGWKVEVGEVTSASGAAKTAFDAAFGADYTGAMSNNLRGMADEAAAAGDHFKGMGEFLIDGATAPLSSLEALKTVVTESSKEIENVVDPTVAATDALGGGSGSGSGKGLAGGADKAAKAMKDAQREAKKLADEIKQLEYDADPLLKYNDELNHLKDLLEQGLSDNAFDKAVEKLNDELADSYPLIGDVSDAFGEFVAGGLKDFNGFVDSILGSFKSMLSQMISTASRNKIMLSMGIGGGGVGAAASALGGGSGIGGMGGGLLGSVGSLGSVFMNSLSTTAGSFMSGGLGAGIGQIGSTLGAVSGSLGSLAAAAGAVALPLAAAYGAFKFFTGSTKELDAGIRLNIEGNELLAESYRKTQKSRFFGLSKRTSESGSPLENTGLSKAYASIYDGAEQAAWALGLSSKALKGYTDEIKISTKGMDEAQAQAAVMEALQQTQNGLAREFFEALGKGSHRLIADSEEVSAAMNRVYLSVATVSPLLDILGGNVARLGLAGANAATKFVGAIGGLDQAASAVGSYIDLFFSQREKIKVIEGDVRRGLNGAGLLNATPQNQTQFRALVDRQLAAGNAENAAALIRLAPTFDQWITMRQEALASETQVQRDGLARIAAVASERDGLWASLDQMRGLTDKIRARELAALAPANRALQQRIYALADATAAEERASQAMQAFSVEREGIWANADKIRGLTDKIRERELAALDPANRALQEWVYGLEDAAAAAGLATQKEQERLEAERSIADERDSLWASLDQVRGLTDKIRARELASLAPANRALQERIYALEDAAAAEEAAAGALSERMGIQRQIWELQGNENALRAYTLSGLDASNKALQKQYWALSDQKDAQDALATAAEEATSAIEAMIDAVDPNKFATRFAYDAALSSAARGMSASRITSTGVPIAAVPKSKAAQGDVEMKALRDDIKALVALNINLNADVRKMRQNSDRDQAIGTPAVRTAS